jgi:hypothetical protein
MLKVERICVGKTNEWSVFNHCYENPFGNFSKESIIDRELLGPRTPSKSFDLSMCNMIMCFAFHAQNSVS